MIETAALLDAYTTCCASGEMPPSPEEVFITNPSSPDASMRGTNDWMPCATPRTLTPNTHSQSDGSVSQTSRLGTPTPALLHRMWQAPCVANTRSASADTEAGSDTSVTTPVTLPPSSWTAFSSAGCSTSAITTFMPSPTKALASALPMPLAPPVTTATRSRNTFIADLQIAGAPRLRRLSVDFNQKMIMIQGHRIDQWLRPVVDGSSNDNVKP